MNIQKFAAFSDGQVGGNPAGVLISEELPEAVEMQHIAAEVGFSETAFATPLEQGFRVRYFRRNRKCLFAVMQRLLWGLP